MSNPIDELLNRPIPEKLWHYTSIQGFQGIVTNKSMWATDLRFLNDYEEFVHSRNIADKIVEQTPELNAKKLLATAVKLAFDSGPLPKSEVFVASFSAAEDQLGQWRGYSHGSTGVSLAFNLTALRPPSNIGTFASFAPCEYDSVKKEQLVLHALHHLKEEVEGYWERTFEEACKINPEKRNSTDKEQVAREFLEANPSRKATVASFETAVLNTRIDFLRIGALLKHSAFQEEREWRLVLPIVMDLPTPMQNPPRFRVERTTLVPYIAHPFSGSKPVPLVDVILGPGSNINSVFAAERFLKSQNLNVPVRLSKVPYRAS